jgi:polyisoprenoid-binding protein YceI
LTVAWRHLRGVAARVVVTRVVVTWVVAAGVVAACVLGFAAGAAQAQPSTYALDITHTFVTWEVLHGGISTTRGRFDKKQGTIELDRAAKVGRIDIQIDITSLRTGVPAFDAALMSPEFFDATAHPSARFVADRFGFDGDKLNRVNGTLSLRGKTLPLTLTALRFNCYLNPLFRREVCGGDFEAQIKRSDWGVGPGSPLIADEVKLLIQVEAIKL